MENVFSFQEICAKRIFRVPDYQRGYAWDVDPHCEELFEDIRLLSLNKEHYTGTLVLHKVKNSNGETAKEMDAAGTYYEVHDIVDGQQRLATIFILLDAIRRKALEVPNLVKFAEGIKDYYLFREDQNQMPLYKLTLNSDCNEFFKHNIFAETPGPAAPRLVSHERLLAAKNYFWKKLEEIREGYDISTFGNFLRDLHHKITQKLKVTLYEVSNDADVGVIFEVMNDRGKKLTELEKVKNFLLYLTTKLNLQGSPGNELARGINSTWTNIFEGLMSTGSNSGADEDQLLRAHWFMMYDADRKKWDGSKTIKFKFHLKNYIDNHENLLQSLTEYTRTLNDAAIAYCDIICPRRTGAFAIIGDNSSKRQIITLSNKFLRIKTLAPFLPLLIATRLKYPDDKYKYLTILSLCELFAFRVYRLIGKRTDAGQQSLFTLANRLYSGKIPYNKLIDCLKWLINKFSPNEEWLKEFQLDNIKNDWYNWKGLKYFLYEYEEYLAKNHDLQLPWDVLERKSLEESIEHILPQTPNDAYWNRRFNDAAQKKYLHDIGNLSLTVDNSSYKNKKFPDKKGKPGQNKPCYSNANLFMERYLAKFKDWTSSSIRTRRKEIIDWALKRWEIELIDTSTVPYDEIILSDDNENNDD